MKALSYRPQICKNPLLVLGKKFYCGAVAAMGFGAAAYKQS